MKPIPQETVDKNVDYMVDGITHVIKTFGKRDPGSEGERKANEHFAKELSKYADDVKTEEFTLHADSFMGWIYFEIAFVFIALAALWVNLNIVALALAVLGVALLIAQLVFYKHVTAPFFRKKTSTNVMASLKPTGEIKRRIVFCGHTDAAFEWGWLNIGGFPLFLGTVLCAIASIFLIAGIAIAGMVLNGFSVGFDMINGTYQIVLIAITAFSVPAILLMLHFSNRRMVVDGANDNLTACMASISVLKTMKEEGITFENTEVCAMMAGSEEAGLRGAMAYAKAHKEELQNGPETIFVVLETLREVDHLTIYNRDMNGVVKVDPQVCRLVQIAAKEAIGRDIPFSTVTLGATDSAAFANAGLKSTCFAALDHHLQRYYHTRRDTYDNLSKECLDLTYKVCMKTAEIYDKDGLPEA